MSEPGTLDTIDIMRVMEMLPHRYPFLMIDKMVNIIPHKSATGIKNITINEPQFQGHFPSRPIMPGVLIIEAMAQTAGALVVHSMGQTAEGKLVYFMSIDDARFRKPAGPGDTMFIHVVKQHSRGNVWRFHGEAKVGDTLIAEATYAAMIMDR